MRRTLCPAAGQQAHRPHRRSPGAEEEEEGGQGAVAETLRPPRGRGEGRLAGLACN